MARKAEITAPSRDARGTRDVAAALADPPRATLWASLTYALFTVVLGYGAFAGQFLVNARSDQYIAGYAFRDFAAQSLKAGHGIPQWNPYLMGGLPYIAAMHGDIFYPTALLRWILPTDVAMTWEFMIHLFLCGLFTYLFLRAWGFGFWSALLGGASYMLGGSIAGYASPGHDGKLFVSTMLPALLLALTRGVRDGRTWAWGAIAVVVGLALLSPHPQLSQYLLLAGGAFAIYAAFSHSPERGKLPTNVALTRLGFALGAVVLGMLASAVQYMPVIEYTPWSPRNGGHDWATATSYSFPIEETINWYWPQFSGILDNYWGPQRRPSPQRLFRRRRTRACWRSVRRRDSEIVPPILDWRWHRLTAVGIRRLHAVLSHRRRNHPGHDVLPRPEHDYLHHGILRRGSRRAGRRATADETSLGEVSARHLGRSGRCFRVYSQALVDTPRS